MGESEDLYYLHLSNDYLISVGEELRNYFRESFRIEFVNVTGFFEKNLMKNDLDAFLEKDTPHSNGKGISLLYDSSPILGNKCVT